MSVKPESEMDDDTLVKHFNARHMPLRGMAKLVSRNDGERLLRLYHARVHDKGIEDGREVNHDHVEPEATS